MRLPCTETFGGEGSDVCAAITLDASGAVYLGGSTRSADFPTTLTPPLDPNRDQNEAFVLKLGDPQFDTVAKGDRSHDVFRVVARNPTDRDYGYWEYRVAATGQLSYGRAFEVRFDATAGLKMNGTSTGRFKVTATFDYDTDTATVRVANTRSGRKFKIVDRDNSQTPMP